MNTKNPDRVKWSVDPPSDDSLYPPSEASPDISTGILLSTLWGQSGVLSIGNNTTVTCNEYTPTDPGTSKHSLTGCTNTAAAQIIYYFIENKGLALSLTLTASDAYTSSHGGTVIYVKADGSTPGTISFAAVNSYLGGYKLNSAPHAAALLYACGVVQQADYSSSATSTAWSADLFYRSGFQSANFFYASGRSATYYWGTTDAQGNFTISDAGFEVLIENLQAGRPVGTSYPGHALVIDGYDGRNDTFHINFGWGKSSSTRWYTRGEMIAEGYYEFVYDLFIERIETLTVTDSRFYGTGTMARAFEQARSIRGGNTVTFNPAVADARLELFEYTKLSETTTVRDFNMTVTVTNARNWSWGAAFYGQSDSITTFENFGGALIVNTGLSGNVAFYFSSAGKLSLSANHALIYAGSYSVGGNYSSGAAAVLAAMRTASDSGSAVASFVSDAAAGTCYSVYGTDSDDTIALADHSLVVGDVYLKGGKNQLELSDHSLLCGDVTSGSGDDTVTISDHSQVEGNISLGSGNDSLSVLGGSHLYGDISGSGSNTITVDSTGAIAGALYARAEVNFVLNSAARDHALFTIEKNVYNVYDNATKITVDIAEAEIGSYVLFAAADSASYAEWLGKLSLTVTGSGENDYTLVGNGTSTSTCADLIYENRMLKLNVNLAPSDLLPKVLSVSADITALTTHTVTVSAVFNEHVQTAQYSLDNQTWKTYTAGVVMSSNGTVYFRGIDAANRISEVVSYEVANIEVVIPDKPVASANTTAPTNQDVIVKATFGGDTAKKQYSLNGITWKNYQTAGVTMKENGTVYFRAVSASGGKSEVTSYTVSNIDKVAPNQPTASANTTAPTDQVVIVTAKFSADSALKQYSLDNRTWRSYTTGVVLRRNGTVYFRGIDAAGNASDVTSYEVANITGAPKKTPGDLNGDGRADVILSIIQAGHGAEGATGAWLIQDNQTAAWGDLSQRNAGWSIFGAGCTSVGKSTNDVYVKSTGNVIGAWVTDDDGRVTGWETVGSFDTDTQILGLGDFNGDGQTDLLLRNVNGAVGCFFTSGDKTGWNYFQSLGPEWKITAVGDLNGDGRSDVVLKHDTGFAGSWLTQDDGTMAWANLDTLNAGFEIVGAGDFDGDGTDDVLLKNGNYYGAWLVQNGNAAGWFGIGDLGNVTVEQIGDFDGDGKCDLRIRTAAGDIGAQLVRSADTIEWKYYGSVGSEWNTALAAI